MYRVQNDKRCLESCEMIYRALLKTILLPNSNINLSSITVSELSRQSSISRGTFYRHFDSVLDVLIWKADTKISDSCDTSILLKDNRQFCRIFFNYWTTQHLFLNSLLRISRLDLLLSSLEVNIVNWSSLLFDGEKLSVTKRDYLVRIWAVIIWSILCTWIRKGRKESPEELTKIAMNNLPTIHH